MKEKLKRIFKILKDLPKINKFGFLLWILGLPIGGLGFILLTMGNYFWGAFFFFLPLIEGNLGLLLMGKGVMNGIKKEFFKKSS